MTPHMQAIAFRVWQYCEPLGWDVTMQDVADALDISVNTVGVVAKQKGWSRRFRSPPHFDQSSGIDMIGSHHGYGARLRPSGRDTIWR